MWERPFMPSLLGRPLLDGFTGFYTIRKVGFISLYIVLITAEAL